MTEIPEHLLKRAQAAKAKATGEPAPAEAPAEAAAPTQAAVPAEATTPAPVVEAPPEPVAPYNEAAASRKKIPWWAAGALLLLPIWAISYVGTLERPPQEATGVMAEGAHVYEARCASCHGATGGGGSGYAMADGEILATFPSAADHVVWVARGSDSFGLGNAYGDPSRGRIVEGGMPGWADVLTTEELIGVVLYERAGLSGSDEDAALAEALDHAIEAGDLDLHGHLDPTTVTADEVEAILGSVAHDDGY
ncbi:MAG: cytochrome c [Actinomycetota bacterium]|nr:cytochrome c [Actinomycetota bacterium]MEC9395876.1 cytochrome c [Actinomycetota bacterium]MEE2958427.1 cytochrome c [Actinomycetota bacterium]